MLKAAVSGLIGLIFIIYIALKIGHLSAEADRQSRILFAIAIALKADIPGRLRPREGFFGEFRRALRAE